MVYTEEEAFKICDILVKIFLDKKLIVILQRDTIVAEKLASTITIGQLNLGANAIKDGDFLDPFIGMERGKANYNTQFDKGKIEEVVKKAKVKEQDALDKKIAEFMAHKRKVPPPEVRHEKGDNFKKDIMIPNVTLIVGGKPLLECATLKLVKGKKYGLVGRNGIGKTCLINAISREEIEQFPEGLHILQVEQEVEGDEKTVLQHILDCDVEMNSLLAEQAELIKTDLATLQEPALSKHTKRLVDIANRLEVIQANTTESKAMRILKGIGFSEEDCHKPSNSFSGGWRMRIAIAKVIFCEPEILMLDEPTNHLDLPALIWLENYI
jgi:ATP-binding cassette, subfamily F, member 3